MKSIQAGKIHPNYSKNQCSFYDSCSVVLDVTVKTPGLLFHIIYLGIAF